MSNDDPGGPCALTLMLERRDAVMVPGVANALSARIAEDLGFQALYLTGAGVTNTYYGLPDLAFVGVTELADHTAAIRDVVGLPIIVDGDTGFGNALNVRNTVRRLERVGASALQIEDQASPKKCGHFAGKALIPTQEMTAKVRAAVDARHSSEFLIVARTDARAVEGLEPALARAHAYIEAGADVMFVEAPESTQEMRRIAAELPAPQIANMVVGGRTPIVDCTTLADMGFAMTLYANAALQGAVLGMQRALGQLKSQGRLDESDAVVASFEERQRLVAKPEFDALSERYASGEAGGERSKN
ncbi:MAG: isocitrate lyase/PEP mutase family protein [Gammaproteobacteria bacterium]